jgi:hypothetical protein
VCVCVCVCVCLRLCVCVCVCVRVLRVPSFVRVCGAGFVRVSIGNNFEYREDGRV